MHSGLLHLPYWVWLTTTLHLLTFLSVTAHALQRRRNASATLLWIFVAWSLPAIGPLLYLSFGIDRVPDKGLRKRLANQHLMEQRQNRHKSESPFVAWHYNFSTRLTEIKNPYQRELNTCLNVLNPDHPLLDANAITPLLSGEQTYPLMLEAIQNARNHIHLQSFIISPDTTGLRFLEALKTKAEEGVQVRLLYDRFGSTRAFLTGLFRKYRNLENFTICGWTQANPLKRQFQLNLRNHRKTLIIDGQHAFFGGVNLSDENLPEAREGGIRDYHFSAKGPLVHELQFSFLRDWYFMTHEPVENLLNADLFPKLDSAGKARARLIDTGPSEPPQLATESFFNAIILAQSQIQIVTPYFVPNPEILRALRSAAQRGIEVQLVLPQKNNHRYAGWASRALYSDLLKAGVRIYHRPPPFIHAKAMIVDNCAALIGTANLDIRSLELNYETMVLIEDEQAIDKLKQFVHEDIDASTEITLNEWEARPAIQKLAENLCTLMSPVL